MPRKRTKAETQARAEQALDLSLTGLGWREIAQRLDYGNPGNAWRAAQRCVDTLPDPGNAARRRSISHQRLDLIWKLAHAQAAQGDVPAMRVMVEIERRRALLDGLDRPTVLQLDGPDAGGQQQIGPTLREVLPPEVVADHRSVRAQALALHRALPVAVDGEEVG